MKLAALLLVLALCCCGALHAQTSVNLDVEPGKSAKIDVPFVASKVVLKPADPALLNDRLFAVESGYQITLGGDCPEADIIFLGPANPGEAPPTLRVTAKLKGGPEPAPGPNPPDPIPPPPEKPCILGPEQIMPGEPLWLTADLEEGSVATWTVEAPDGLAFKTFEDQRQFSSAGPLDAKEVRVALSVARMVGEALELRVVRKIVRVGESPNPPPDPPKPPGPEPPTPGPAPIPVAGLHVLVTVETGEKLTPGEQAVLYGEEVRNYLESACQLYTDGSKAFRIYDKDIDISADWSVWQEAMKRPRSASKWVIVSNGVTGYEGPLPATPEEMLALLKQYEVKK